MRLTKKDKEILLTLGYEESDFSQIQKATLDRYTTYTLFEDNTDKDIKTLSQKEVLEIMDRKEYLSGIARSAFHWSSVRDTTTLGLSIYFSSRRLFK